MHYSCLVVGDPYLAMNPYCGNYNGWVYDENYDIYRDTNGNKIDENRIYCDYFNIGGRWDSYIGIKDKEDEPYKSTYDNMYVSEEQKKIGGGCSSAVKKNIIGFIDRKHGRTNKYPNTFAYIDDKGIHEMPEDWDYRLDNGDIDKVEFKKAKAKWRKNYIKWYKSIPDDEIITIIDYHM